MTVLPIVDRELRVAARKTSTYRWRAGAALVAIVVVGFLLVVAGSRSQPNLAQLGPQLFGVLKWLAFLAVSLAGVFFTADCLSEEKRQGTLGLLFLTDLRGHDVVLGKLLATSLQVVYALLAVFPIMGLVFLLGGVTGGEFGRVLLALGNALFFSLTLGVLVSSVSRDAQRAIHGTMLAVLGFFLLTWVMDGLISDASRSSMPFARLVNPSFAFVNASSGDATGFWLCLTFTHGLGWIFLAYASYMTPRNWQEKPAGAPAPPPPPPPSQGAVASPPAPRRRERRQRLLATQPAAWLVGYDRWAFWIVRVVVYGAGLFVVFLLLADEAASMVVQLGRVVLLPVNLLFALLFASQAIRFPMETRRNGLMELLLATPLTTREIVSGQWRALRDLFLGPALTLVAMHLLLGVTGAVRIGGPARAPDFSRLGMWLLQILTAGAGLITFLTGLLALGWFGIWMGLASRNTSTALLKTLAFTKVVPWFALVFAQAVLGLGLAPAGWSPWWPVTMYTVMRIGVDTFLIAMARLHVLQKFRSYAAPPAGLQG